MYIPGYGVGRVEDRGGDIQGELNEHRVHSFCSRIHSKAWNDDDDHPMRERDMPCHSLVRSLTVERKLVFPSGVDGGPVTATSQKRERESVCVCVGAASSFQPDQVPSGVWGCSTKNKTKQG